MRNKNMKYLYDTTRLVCGATGNRNLIPSVQSWYNSRYTMTP